MVKKQEKAQEKAQEQVSEIWETIKNKPIEMFGLPDQKVHQYVSVIGEFGGNLYVRLKVSAVLPSLEAAIAPDFEVELQDKMVAIKKKSVLEFAQQ